MRELLIRHPVTAANEKGIVEGSLYGEISQRGYEQIKKLLERLKSERIDIIYSSDFGRCRILAEKISVFKEVVVQYDPLFREINNGDWTGMKKGEIQRMRADNPLYLRPPNGESLADMAIRSTQASNLIKEKGRENNVIISHGWFLKTFLGLQLGMDPLRAIKCLKFSNCAISEILIEGDRCSVEYLNNRDYLR